MGVCVCRAHPGLHPVPLHERRDDGQHLDGEAVDLVFESETYRNIIPIRDIAFLDYNVSIVSD